MTQRKVSNEVQWPDNKDWQPRRETPDEAKSSKGSSNQLISPSIFTLDSSPEARDSRSQTMASAHVLHFTATEKE